MKHSKINEKEAIRLKRQGYTQKQIAKRLGVTRQAISFILLKEENRHEIGEVGVKL